MKVHTLTAAALTVAALLPAAGALAGVRDDADLLANRLQQQTRELASEIQHHYRTTAGYSHLKSDVSTFYREIMTLRADLRRVSDPRMLDDQAHHLIDDLDHIQSQIADIEWHAQGRPSWHGGVIGDTWHLRRLISEMKVTLERLHAVLQLPDNNLPGLPHGHGVPQVLPYGPVGPIQGVQVQRPLGWRFVPGLLNVRF